MIKGVMTVKASTLRKVNQLLSGKSKTSFNGLLFKRELTIDANYMITVEVNSNQGNVTGAVKSHHNGTLYSETCINSLNDSLKIQADKYAPVLLKIEHSY